MSYVESHLESRLCSPCYVVCEIADFRVQAMSSFRVHAIVVQAMVWHQNFHLFARIFLDYLKRNSKIVQFRKSSKYYFPNGIFYQNLSHVAYLQQFKKNRWTLQTIVSRITLVLVFCGFG
jgi:hypothetical protein